jgi:hypothetical protein
LINFDTLRPFLTHTPVIRASGRGATRAKRFTT